MDTEISPRLYSAIEFATDICNISPDDIAEAIYTYAQWVDASGEYDLRYVLFDENYLPVTYDDIRRFFQWEPQNLYEEIEDEELTYE